ncbi:MAG: type II secretion system F family protein [bacterium]
MSSSGTQSGYWSRLLEPKITYNDVVNFTQQLAFMIEEGLSLTKSLHTLHQQETQPKFKRLIFDIITQVELGIPFSEACQAHLDTLSQFFVSMMKAGEEGMGLPEVLRRVATHLEKENEQRKKIKQVFTYPIVICSFCGIIVSCLVIFIIPVFAKVYMQLGANLPIPTQILIKTSDIIRTQWIVILGVGVLAFLVFSHPKSTQFRKKIGHKLLMSLPILGQVSRKAAISKFVRTFSSLLVCHVLISDALSITEDIVADPEISQKTKRIKEKIESGDSITKTMKDSHLFSPMIIQMVNVGEEGGNMGELLEKCAIALESEVDNMAKKALVIIEPTLTLGVAVIVGFIALAIYLPMFDMMGHVQ